MINRTGIAVVALAVTTLIASRPAPATWSIAIADGDTKEVACGTITCLTNFDLLATVPVIIVEKGAAASQSAIDSNGERRLVMFEGLMDGTDPDVILEMLAEVTGHQSRQYGLVDTLGRAMTFTGSSANDWAGGRTFTIGSTTYAIQGNILAGECVIDAIEDAIRDSGGDIPDQLMAGMQAAAAAGGDGRCSCGNEDPTGCGCPVKQFDKSGHIGCMVVARVGDTDDTACTMDGCADGDYFMTFNVAFQGNNDPEPADQLRDQFDAWRAEHVGRPDAVRSLVSFDPPGFRGGSTHTMTIALRDWQELPIEVAIESVTVEHGTGSLGLTEIGKPVDQGGGVFTVTLTSGSECGLDRYVVTVDDGTRPVVLTPPPTLRIAQRGDIDADGQVDFNDLLRVLDAWGPYEPCTPFMAADIDENCEVDFDDLLAVLDGWGPCAIPQRACCLPGSVCIGWPEDLCAEAGGIYREGITCENGCEEPTDDCADAFTVGDGSYWFSTRGASTDGENLPPKCDEGNGTTFRRDVWIRYRASCTGTATASICAADYNSKLAIYDVSDCPGEIIACSDDACGENGTRSETSFDVVEGTEYIVRLGGRTSIGEGVLELSCAGGS